MAEDRQLSHKGKNSSEFLKVKERYTLKSWNTILFLCLNLFALASNTNASEIVYDTESTNKCIVFYVGKLKCTLILCSNTTTTWQNEL